MLWCKPHPVSTFVFLLMYSSALMQISTNLLFAEPSDTWYLHHKWYSNLSVPTPTIKLGKTEWEWISTQRIASRILQKALSMVLDLPQRVPGLAGKTSLCREVRLSCSSLYLSNRTSCRAHWYSLWAKANEHTAQTAHLVKGRIIHQQFPVWPTNLKNPLNAISSMRIRSKCDRRRILQGSPTFTCTHTL